MAAKILEFPRPSASTGALEALDRVLEMESETDAPEDVALCLRDRILARLWVEGFKIVPLEESDAS